MFPTKGRAAAEGLCILAASLAYAVGTVWFIFPHGLFLGGTSGISVILTAFLPFPPGMLLMVINMALLVLAFAILGRRIAFKTLLGSTATALMIAAVERYATPATALIEAPWLSGVVGALILAAAGGLLFFVDASSGGTDIVALVVRRFFTIHIGRALFLTDILIVLVGGALTSLPLLLCSALGLAIKAFGIDAFVALYARLARLFCPKKQKDKGETAQKSNV